MMGNHSRQVSRENLTISEMATKSATLGVNVRLAKDAGDVDAVDATTAKQKNASKNLEGMYAKVDEKHINVPKKNRKLLLFTCR